MQPIFISGPVAVAIRAEDLYVTLPDGAGTFVLPGRDGLRLAVNILIAIADHCGGNEHVPAIG